MANSTFSGVRSCDKAYSRTSQSPHNACFFVTISKMIHPSAKISTLLVKFPSISRRSSKTRYPAVPCPNRFCFATTEEPALTKPKSPIFQFPSAEQKNTNVRLSNSLYLPLFGFKSRCTSLCPWINTRPLNMCCVIREMANIHCSPVGDSMKNGADNFISFVQFP